MPRLQLGHFLQFIPLIGRKHRIGDYPYPGSNQTVFKAAHGMTAGEQITRYGANARHISNLSDPDENYFVLLGGQDGQFNSRNFADQVGALDERGIR